jgi:hypothetical protein
MNDPSPKKVWQERLDFLLVEEAKASDSVAKFSLAKAIDEANRKLKELEPEEGSAFAADISRIIKYAPAQLIGREAETKLLNEAWAKAQNNETKRPHVLTFVALGGEGKTSLVAKWAADLAHQNWPGCDAVFAWSFYSQGTREEAQSSSDVFLKEALTFFGDTAMAGSAQGAFDKGRRLAQLAGERRALLILDGLEPLQYAPGPPMDGKLKDDGLAALLNALAASNKGLCVVTTRYSIPDLRAYMGGTVHEEELKRLSNKAGVELLRRLGVTGGQKDFETLVEDVKGHALTLNLLGSYLRDAYDGDIRRRDQVKLGEADEEQGRRAFRVMDAYGRWFESEEENGERALAMLRLMGLFDRPADADCLKALWKAPGIPDLTEPLAGISEAQRNLAITRLKDAKLLTVNRDGSGAPLALDSHPLLREYFARQLRAQHPEAWRAAHRRLYEHLCTTTEDKPQPTLEDLHPSTRPFPTVVRRGCSRKHVTRFTSTALSGGRSFIAQINSARSVPTWEPPPASSSNRGAASRPRSRKPTKAGCWALPPSTCARWDG